MTMMRACMRIGVYGLGLAVLGLSIAVITIAADMKPPNTSSPATPGSLVQADGKQMPKPDANGHLQIPDGTITIPGFAYYRNTAIKSVTIPPTVTKIDDGAFSYCSNLATVTFSGTSSLQTIGRHAFYNTGLTSIEIPPSVTEIDESAFALCSNLAKVTFVGTSSLETIGERAFYYTGLMTSPSTWTTSSIPSTGAELIAACCADDECKKIAKAGGQNNCN